MMSRILTASPVAVLLISCAAPITAQQDNPASDPALTSDDAGRFVNLALGCVHKEYPNKIAHVLAGDEDVKPPRELTPIFYGCFDWHSAVHGHWLLVRAVRTWPDASWAERARAALAQSFTAEGARVETIYLDRKDRHSFERPYGLAWLLQLCAELREWNDADAREWSGYLEPLEQMAAARFKEWLPKLSHAIRTGEHSQTAFALGLVLDWSRTSGDKDLEALIIGRARAWHLLDRGGPLAFEPGGQDFLSPCLAEADLMRRVLEPAAFAAWLGAFLPNLPLEADARWLPPAVVTDKSDGKLAHLDGLNLSRAWMLEGIIAGLPKADPRRAALADAARQHSVAGIASVTGEDYAGGHWLGSFAMYLVSRRGVGDAAKPR